MHSCALTATWNASRLPERVDALATQGYRPELTGILARRMLWGHGSFKDIAYPDALGTTPDQRISGYEVNSLSPPCASINVLLRSELGP